MCTPKSHFLYVVYLVNVDVGVVSVFSTLFNNSTWNWLQAFGGLYFDIERKNRNIYGLFIPNVCNHIIYRTGEPYICELRSKLDLRIGTSLSFWSIYIYIGGYRSKYLRVGVYSLLTPKRCFSGCFFWSIVDCHWDWLNFLLHRYSQNSSANFVSFD